MKKIIRNKIFLIVILCIISCGMGIAAANIYQANTIEYSPTDSSWEVSNVSDALNDLYNITILGNANETQILSGKTAVVQGKTLIGTMSNMKGLLQLGTSFSVSESGTIGQSDYVATGSIKIPTAGYYDTDSTLTFDLAENNNSYYSLGMTKGGNYTVTLVIWKRRIYNGTGSNISDSFHTNVVIKIENGVVTQTGFPTSSSNSIFSTHETDTSNGGIRTYFYLKSISIQEN